MRVSVCLGAILIPEYLDFHSGYSTPGSRIAGIYSGIYIYIYPNERALSFVPFRYSTVMLIFVKRKALC